MFEGVDRFFMDEVDIGARTSGKNLTCVWCRAKWILPAPAGGIASRSMTSEGYMNLGDVAGVNTSRDTSSCKLSIWPTYKLTTVDPL
jgi:hypothetical protein